MVLEFTENLVSLSTGGHPLKLEAMSRNAKMTTLSLLCSCEQCYPPSGVGDIEKQRRLIQHPAGSH